MNKKAQITSPVGNMDFSVAPVQTKKQFAQTMQMSPRTIVEWMSQGMPFLRPGPRKTLFVTADAIAWVKQKYQVDSNSPSRPEPKKRVRPVVTN